MIHFKTGNILTDEAQAIVNTVNCVGVMGKGLALQYKKAFPRNFKEYKAACDKQLVTPGKMFITKFDDILESKFIINFPTKKHWKGASKIEYIDAGLDDLICQIKELNITSVAIPPLGAGLGGLDWTLVKSRIVEVLSPLKNIDIIIYEPKGSPVPTNMINKTNKPNMTRGRALLIKLLEFYFEKGYECSKIEAQKLAYFLQESGIDLRLRYVAHHFGPYADNLNHVLERIDGHFIEGFGDRVNTSQIKLIKSSLCEANKFLENDTEAKSSLNMVESLIDGYETPLSMEVLATVHWVVKHENYELTNFDGIKSYIQQWNERKASWKDSYLKKAIIRLESCQWV